MVTPLAVKGGGARHDSAPPSPGSGGSRDEWGGGFTPQRNTGGSNVAQKRDFFN